MTRRLTALAGAVLVSAALVAAGCADDDPSAGASSPTPVASVPAAPDPAAGAMLRADGGATVGELQRDDIEGAAIVRAHLVVTADGARLCDGLRESMPPQCGDPSMPAVDVPAEVLRDLRSAQGVRWSEEALTLGGHVGADGSFRVDPGVLARS